MSRPMRLRHLVAILSALIVMLGISSTAFAATATSGTAEPGTYAARHGAPLCDDRAASSYAADPEPPRADGTEVAKTAAPGCRDSSMTGKRVDTGSRDDLQRSQPLPKQVAMLPSIGEPQPHLLVIRSLASPAPVGAELCDHRRHDTPPPRSSSSVR